MRLEHCLRKRDANGIEYRARFTKCIAWATYSVGSEEHGEIWYLKFKQQRFCMSTKCYEPTIVIRTRSLQLSSVVAAVGCMAISVSVLKKHKQEVRSTAYISC